MPAFYLILKKNIQMIKQKLKEIREKRFNQEDFAIKLGMDASMYNRRENGNTKITK